MDETSAPQEAQPTRVGEVFQAFLIQGFTAGDIQWPTPKRIPFGPLVSYGYEDRVVLPITITVPQNLPAGDVALTGHANWLVCSNVCVPEETDI